MTRYYDNIKELLLIVFRFNNGIEVGLKNLCVFSDICRRILWWNDMMWGTAQNDLGRGGSTHEIRITYKLIIVGNWVMGLHYTSHSQSVVAGPEAWAPPGNLLECKHFGPHPRSTKSETGAQQFILTIPLGNSNTH